MKILQVHNYYRQRGGEASVVEVERNLLEKNGHKVYAFNKDSIDQSGLLKTFKTVLEMPYSKSVFNEFKQVLYELKPDIVHVHNTFPLITPSVFYACKKCSIPVVLTLHNYRLIYPNALLMHDGKIDLRTFRKSAFSVVKDKVYQNSILKTLSVARLIEYHKKRNTWNTQVDKFISLTEFGKELFRDWGISEDLLVVKPNFVSDPYQQIKVLKNEKKKDGFLFVGRISREKGIEDLIETWVEYNLKIPLSIIGDGKLKKELEILSTNNPYISWLGFQDKETVFKKLTKVKGLILPSVWFEGFPMTLAEALAIGTPAIVSNIGNQKAIIEDNVSGMHFNVSDKKDLRNKVLKLDSDDDLVAKLSAGARSTYLDQYTEQINYEHLIDIYKSVFE